MLAEAASVVARDGSTLRLQSSRHATCTGCSLKTGCGQYLLARTGRDSGLHDVLTLTPLDESADDLAACRAGDSVRIELPEGRLVLLAMCFYAVPLVLLLLATALTSWLAASEGVVVLGGLAGLASGCLLTRWLLARQALQRQFAPRVRRVSSEVVEAGSVS